MLACTLRRVTTSSRVRDDDRSRKGLVTSA